jgi:hypothetical protein
MLRSSLGSLGTRILVFQLDIGDVRVRTVERDVALRHDVQNMDYLYIQ